MVLIENVKSVPAQLEFEALSDLNRFLQADIEVTVGGLPKILHSWSAACIEIEATCRLESIYVQNGQTWVKVCRRLREWVRAR